MLIDKPTLAGGGVRFAPGQPKVDPAALRVAERINSLTEEKDLVLLPPRIAPVLAGLHNAPRQVAVRSIYVDHMSHYLSAEDAAARKALLAYVSTGSAEPGQWRWFVQQLETRSVDVVVLLSEREFTAPELADALRASGYQQEALPGVEIWQLQKR